MRNFVLLYERDVYIIMSKYIALFSGQGSQFPGMGKELYDEFKDVREVYQCAGDILGYDLADITFNGTEEQLSQTLTAQPAIFAMSVAAYTAARQRISAPEVVMGHSLGEFAALWCAGAFSLEDGFRIIDARAKAMDSVKTPGIMFAILGGSPEEVEEACKKADGFVHPVNFNLPTQTVISGETKACTVAADILEAQGRRAAKLSVSSAFHTSMMQPAADSFKDAIKDISFSPAKIKFISNLTGGELIVEDYPQYFANHMVSPVRFTKQMETLSQLDEPKVCIEFGPKKTVSTLAKKNVRSYTVGNIDDMASLEKSVALLG